MLECNYLTILLAPNYEKPVNSAEDIIDRGLTIVKGVESENLRDLMLNSPNEMERKLGERMLIPEVMSFKPFNIFNSSILFFSGRIGINMTFGLKTRLQAVILLLNIPIWMVTS